jgi:hypothetical protein
MNQNEFNQKELLDKLINIISDETFLNQTGLIGEVPFFICPYPPDKLTQMNDLVSLLKNNLEKKGIQVLHIDLYDLSIELLKERGSLERIIEKEPVMDKGLIFDTLQGMLNVENYIRPEIAKRIQSSDHHVLFITGSGQVFPYIRSHNVLNNLQSVASDHPLVMFFPGEYRHSETGGTTLELFGKMHHDKYYRAYDIHHYQI